MKGVVDPGSVIIRKIADLSMKIIMIGREILDFNREDGKNLGENQMIDHLGNGMVEIPRHDGLLRDDPVAGGKPREGLPAKVHHDLDELPHLRMATKRRSHPWGEQLQEQLHLHFVAGGGTSGPPPRGERRRRGGCGHGPVSINNPATAHKGAALRRPAEEGGGLVGGQLT